MMHESQTDPLFLIYVAAAIQGVFLILIIRSNRENRIPGWKFLMAMIIVFTVLIIDFSLTWSGYIIQLPWFIGTIYLFSFLIGPLLFGFIKSSYDKSPISILYLFHFVPAIISLLYSLPNILESNAIKIENYQKLVATEIYFSSSSYIIASYLRTLHQAIYVVLSWYFYSSKIRNKKNPQEKFTKEVLIWCSSFVILLFIHTTLLDNQYPFYALTYSIMICLMGIMIFWLHWKLILYPIKKVNESQKYEKSGLSHEDLEAIRDKVENYMDQEKPFLVSGLKLNDLANELDLQPHHLSQVLNQKMGQTFSDYINWYRVEFAKKKILENVNGEKTMLQIAYESGFNSKNSFNRSFKKHLGENPSFFKKIKENSD